MTARFTDITDYADLPIRSLDCYNVPIPAPLARERPREQVGYPLVLARTLARQRHLIDYQYCLLCVLRVHRGEIIVTSTAVG